MALPNMPRMGALDCQICVPKEYSNQEAIDAAEELYRCGTSGGWRVVTSVEYLNGDNERVQCERYPENVHIMLEA